MSELPDTSSVRRTITSEAAAIGIDSLRPFQIEALEQIVAKKDVFVVAPTGTGKSLCFHMIPRVLRALGAQVATVVVISPLVWLIEDQISRLVAMGETATRISSWVSSESPAFLFARPEELTKATLARIQGLWERNSLAAFVVDEAHCALNWGDSFRGAYSDLKRKFQIFKNVPKIALTATASPANVNSIANYLGMASP
jgi:superfamily II DNA helicase RecQ